MILAYKTERELLDAIEKAKCEGPIVIFARAALAVRDAETAKRIRTVPDQDPDAPDTRSGEEKLRAAKELVRQSAFEKFQKQQIEQELNRPRGGIAGMGIDDARMKENPRVVYAQPEAPRAISGGGDWSEWV
jgi:hypothetical protein